MKVEIVDTEDGVVAYLVSGDAEVIDYPVLLLELVDPFWLTDWLDSAHLELLAWGVLAWNLEILEQHAPNALKPYVDSLPEPAVPMDHPLLLALRRQKKLPEYDLYIALISNVQAKRPSFLQKKELLVQVGLNDEVIKNVERKRNRKYLY